MIAFKKNVDEVLPYDRQQYIDFFDEDARVDVNVKWYGVSFQLPHVGEGKNISLNEFVEAYEPLFRKVVLKLDKGLGWIVNHEDKDLNWFPNNSDNLTQLRAIFKQNETPNTFKGALIIWKDDLLEISRDLISYPYAVVNKDGHLYKDLNISHGELQVIIKISGHLNIDFLSTENNILKEIVDENSSDLFVVKEYRGTSLNN